MAFARTDTNYSLKIWNRRSPLTQNQPTTKKHDKHNNHCPYLHPKTSHPGGNSEPLKCVGANGIRPHRYQLFPQNME
ncbi:hypothetical protein [Okeania sp. KiyG1]|uniref:hypothetical protein n=1 Tax=Okeania sp. KiyG1 TaxID=2720165 RepID=UPI0019220B09|nr:hypothetical protein [Okeania sp. KiyG1]